MSYKGTKFQNGLSTSKAYAGDSATDLQKALAVTNGIHKTAVIHCVGSSSTATSTALVLPSTCIVKDVYINVITVDAGETVSVGANDATSANALWVVTASLATAGLVVPAITSAAVTRGNLLVDTATAATTSATTMKWDTSSGGKTVQWICSDGTDTGVFDIIIEYVEINSDRPLNVS